MNINNSIITEERALNGEKCDPNMTKNDCCRTCLSTDNLMLIFGNFGEEKMSQNLKLVTGLEIRKNDGLPQKVCTKCLGIFNLTLRFRYECQQAERMLRNMLSVKPTVQYSIEVEVPKITKIKIEKEDYEHIKEENETKVTNIKVERKSEHIDEEIPEITKTKVHVEVHDNENVLVVSPLENISFPNDVQSEDDFEWKEDVKPVDKRKRQKSKPQKEIIRRRTKLPKGPPYPCNICSQEFDTKPVYMKHYKLHVYAVCESCGKRFSSNHSLLIHKRAKHGMEKIYSCAHCKYSSSSKVDLTIHERRHTGERPFICDHCGTTFHRRSNLVQHLPIHLPEKKFLCSLCPQQTKSKKLLQIHVSNVHRTKKYRYKCFLCLSIFVSNKSVHRHLTRVHKLPREEHPVIEKVPIKESESDV